jgi:cadmium resistance protein CadD (predicted permease)
VTALLPTIALAVALFTATNIDDVFLLLAFFADRRYGLASVCLGQFAGMAVLVLASLALSSMAVAWAPEYLRWLGILPVLIGARQLYALWRGNGDDDDAPAASAGNAVVAVAVVTVANGGDNIAVYAPVFANSAFSELAIILVVFTLMTAAWCAAAAWLVKHPAIGPPLERYAHRLLPWILIALGAWILLR